MLKTAVKAAAAGKKLPVDSIPDAIDVEEPKFESHGDFSSNAAMISAPVQKLPPRVIAQAIIDHIQDSEGVIEKMEVAGPGFINFFIRPDAWRPVLDQIHEKGDLYGSSNFGKGRAVQVEFVSANPTGPLHVGHGRGAAVGDSVAKILSFIGYSVQREYYINDSGRQIRTLGNSVYLRYRELSGEKIEFPDGLYKGDYIIDLAQSVRDLQGDSLLRKPESEAVGFCARYAADIILKGIRDDLAAFNVEFDRWYSEQGLYDSGSVDRSIQSFRNRGLIYEKDGALWFKTSEHGDEKDRVVVKSGGETTYFASDIAYHTEKYERGFERVIDVWGADHHGYIPRIRSFLTALDIDQERFDVILVKMVNLLRGGVQIAMSTRAGEFVTLKEVVGEVGSDAARFIFLTRHYESPLDFDLEVAKKKSNDNPVYYVQYVHARICSIVARGLERGIDAGTAGPEKHSGSIEPEEIRLIKLMNRYPEVVLHAGRRLEPHRITYFLTELASAFHTYYNKHRVLADDIELTRFRLYLVLAVRKIIKNGLELLGVSAPEKM